MGYSNIMIYLTSTLQTAIVAAERQISVNCGFPNDTGTERWAIPQQSIDKSIWLIPKPPTEGYNLDEFSQTQMMQNVNLSAIIEQAYNANWFPISED